MSTVGQLIAKNIERLRKAKGLTKTQLAEALGITRQSISRYESGEGGATLSTIKQLAEYFEVDEADLVRDDTQEEWDNRKWEVFDKRMKALEGSSRVPADLFIGLTHLDNAGQDAIRCLVKLASETPDFLNFVKEFTVLPLERKKFLSHYWLEEMRVLEKRRIEREQEYNSMKKKIG